MIKTNELRIGNCVLLFVGVNDDGDIWKEYYIDSGFDLYKLDENDCLNIKPIPLTEEWLVRFGFEKLTPKGSIYGLEDFNIQNFYPLGFFECSNHIRIKSVHQLQNLYFALTGEELNEISQ